MISNEICHRVYRLCLHTGHGSSAFTKLGVTEFSILLLVMIGVNETRSFHLQSNVKEDQSLSRQSSGKLCCILCYLFHDDVL